MKTNEVNEEIIGKRCKCIFTGLMVTGTIEEVQVTNEITRVKVQFDEPHVWGNHTYSSDWSFARLHDEFGSLQYLGIIDDNYHTIKVTFAQRIQEINKMLVYDYDNWQTVNLKEWVDNYESSRCTQINEQSAIITSEYNIEQIIEWLKQNTQITSIEKLH